MKKKILEKSVLTLMILEFVLVLILFSFFPNNVFAGIAEDNVTVQTFLDVGTVYPEVLRVEIEEGASNLALIPATTRKINCVAIAVDYNGDTDMNVSTAEFFDNVASSYGGGDDNNYHYSNASCNISTTFADWNGYTDDAYLAMINCTFDIWYYANEETWNCTIFLNDTSALSTTNSSTITVDPLLALGLPDSIHYGTVNATYVSDENVTNVTNYGNVPINLSLNGYGFTENDGNAMNCTLGANKNITIINEKYNLTQTTSGALDLTSFIENYVNLTSAPVTKRFDLNYRQNDALNEAWNQTYWRIYVPLGVAGTCQGNVIFGAVQANGT